MCGRQFETLFPGLGTFAQDKQIAWLMWHAAPDRHLPEINRVFEGVPEDLAQVIQNLVAKDPARRYQSADAALAHLRTGMTGVGPPPPPKDAEAEAEVQAEAKRKRMVRVGAIAAMAFSLLLSVVMLLPKTPPAPPPAEPQPVEGIVRNVYVGERMLVLENPAGEPVEFPVSPRDEILINDRKQLLRDLKPDDRVSIEVLKDAAGRTVTRILASRPEVTTGPIAAIEADEGKLTVDVGVDDRQLVVRVPEAVRIVFNGKDQLDGRPVTLADLNVDDRVTVNHYGKPTGRVAIDLSVFRVVTLEGTIRDVDAAKKELAVAPEADPASVVVLPFAPRCEVTVNHRSELGGRMLKPEDLKPGDRATVSHDTQVVRVDAYRILGQVGTIQKVHYAAGSLEVLIEGESKPTSFLAGEKTQITLGGEPAGLDDLRSGDQADITHDSPGVNTPEVLTLSAVRPADPGRWAVLVAIQDYEDASLTKLETPVADATLVRDALVERYRVPANQALLLADVSRVRLEQGVVGLLNRPKVEDRVVVYVAAHAYRDDQDPVFLAPKNFQLSRVSDSGVPLQWLVDEFEKCPAKDKLLLLDCTHSGSGADLAAEPSAAEMLGTLKAPPGRAPLRTVTAIAGTSEGERGIVLADENQGLFAEQLARGFDGEADANRDGRLENTELFSYLDRTMKTASAQAGRPQTPKLFLPDDTPPRLSEEAKKSIRKLASYLAQDRAEIFEVNLEYSIAEKLSGEELDPKLLYAMLLMKTRQRDDASRLFEEIAIANPKLLLPKQGLAWLDLDKRSYASGVDKLTKLVAAIPRPEKPGDPYSEETRQIFAWAGRLREFVAQAASDSLSPPDSSIAQLDAAVVAHTAEAGQLYQQGRTETQQVAAEFDRGMAAGDDATKSRLRIERRQLTRFAPFPYSEAAKRILAGLDQ
jgi:hypothetical protein